MIIVMQPGATERDVAEVVQRLGDVGVDVHVSRGRGQTIIAAFGDRAQVERLPLQAMPAIDRVVPTNRAHRFVSREWQRQPSVVMVAGRVPVGGGYFTAIAGPCAVETEEYLLLSARAVAAAGATLLRGDAFKPRTSPYAFQGLGEAGLKMLATARAETGLPFIAEVLDPRDVELVSSYADIVRVGTRNMQNFTLLTELGRQPKPVMLKRGFTATIDEWLLAAEYIYKEGNHDVILCERGIRTYEPATRNTLDISAVPVSKELSHLPIVIDPSHSAGLREAVAPLARAAVAVGADGFMVDVHPEPERALCDGPQALLPAEFALLMDDVRRLMEALGLKDPALALPSPGGVQP